ncbi:C40 family peptidase [Serratia marcescens]|uniref:C40 family peptidase n=1 Tax=Serratia marcescens TaxID=615 RepID=UPI0007C94972|nr:Mov34/MPN/PAD-1 family protein [Serratia marcescens]OAH25734.1 phage tail protein [Serratia marcescens]
MIEKDILAHAQAVAPAESCGLVVRTEQGVRYFPAENRAACRAQHFIFTPEDYIQASRQGEVVAVVHSHPDGEPFLSTADREHQVNSGLPWWLVCEGRIHRFRCVPPLLGRQFVHGDTDCYGLFRDAYHLAGIDLPDFYRGEDWWRRGDNLYLDNFGDNGFRQVKTSIRPGDIILCCYASSVPNHAAVYLGDQTILHHIPNQLSKREVYTDRWQRMTHSIWRYHAWRPSACTGIYNDLAVALR